MRLAYADPPYPGNAHLYFGHPDYAGEVDHAELLERLQTFDGWALSTSSRSLRYVLELCPENVRILIWLNHMIGRSWEPVIVSPARPISSNVRPRDWIEVEPESFQWRPRPDSYVIGQKPPEFCRWVFRWMGAIPGGEDQLEDIFPGSGSVSVAWSAWNAQPELRPLALTKRGENRRSWNRSRTERLALELQDDTDV